MHVHQLPQQASTSKFPAGPQLEKVSLDKSIQRCRERLHVQIWPFSPLSQEISDEYYWLARTCMNDTLRPVYTHNPVFTWISRDPWKVYATSLLQVVSKLHILPCRFRSSINSYKLNCRRALQVKLSFQICHLKCLSFVLEDDIAKASRVSYVFCRESINLVQIVTSWTVHKYYVWTLAYNSIASYACDLR